MNICGTKQGLCVYMDIMQKRIQIQWSHGQCDFLSPLDHDSFGATIIKMHQKSNSLPTFLLTFCKHSHKVTVSHFDNSTCAVTHGSSAYIK